MKSRKPKTEYDKQKEKWYKKLEKSGFKDIEQDEDNLKDWSTSFTRRNTYKEIEEKQRYYTMAETFLDQYKFDSKRDKIIWEYHCNGLYGREIAKIFKKINIRYGQQAIDKTIKRLKIKMFDMLWAPLKEYHEGADE